MTAKAMRETARLTMPGMSIDTTPQGQHWEERSASLLATLIHAAAISDFTMSDVVEWVDTRNCIPALRTIENAINSPSPDDRPVQALPNIGLTIKEIDNKIAHGLLVNIASTEERERSGIWSTASGTLGAYRSAVALSTTFGNKDEFFDSRKFAQSSDTVYICATGINQSAYAPLIVGLISSIQAEKYSYNTALRHENSASPGDMPMLFALDEIANIAPLPQLQSLISEGTGQGIITLACLQDMSQARTRWGAQASGFMSLFSYTVVLPGIKDIDTLNALETLAGKLPTIERSVSMPITGGILQQIKSRLLHRSPPANTPTITTSTSMQPVLPADAISRGMPGHALVVDEHSQFTVTELTPYYDHEPFRSAILYAERSAALEIAHDQVDEAPYTLKGGHYRESTREDGARNKNLPTLGMGGVEHDL